MRWAFWRKRKPVHVGPTSVDWKPGDMAECVGDNWLLPKPNDPKVGDRLMVSGVFYGESEDGAETGFALTFIGREIGYEAESFRKIVLTDTGADRKVGKRVPARGRVDA